MLLEAAKAQASSGGIHPRMLSLESWAGNRLKPIIALRAAAGLCMASYVGSSCLLSVRWAEAGGYKDLHKFRAFFPLSLGCPRLQVTVSG